MILDGVKDYMPIIIHIAGESEGTSHVWWWGERWGSTLGMQTIGNPTPREYSSMGAKKQRGTSLGQPMSRMDTTARQRWTQIDGWAEPLAWAEESSYKCILGVGKQGTCNIYRRNISRNASFHKYTCKISENGKKNGSSKKVPAYMKRIPWHKGAHEININNAKIRQNRANGLEMYGKEPRGKKSS